MTAADRPPVKPGPWTSHGHDIPGVTVAGTPRPARARCGGPSLCAQCSREAVAAMARPSVTDAAREAVPRLTAKVRELEAERDKAREECGHEKAMRKFASDERDRFIKNFMAARDERDTLAAKLARVEALHQPSPEQVDDAGVAYRLCLHCTYINRYGRQRYPCPTVTALAAPTDTTKEN